MAKCRSFVFSHLKKCQKRLDVLYTVIVCKHLINATYYEFN